MKDFVVNVSTKTSKVYLEETSVAVDGENIAGQVIFKFNDDEFIDGMARLEWQNGTDKYFQLMEKVGKTYVLPIKNVMTKEGKMHFQLVITQPEIDEEIPVFKSNQFYVFVEKSINAEGEAPSGYDTWLDYANAKLMEMDNLNITASKSGNTETITLTDKDGVEHKTYIYDGERGPQGPVGPAGQDGKDAKINGVNTLNIEAGENITIEQQGNTLTINSETIGSGNVDDVLVNGTSVVENKVANVSVPTALNDLSDDSTHRLVTDVEKTTWNNKSNFSGNYNDLTNKPTIPTKVSDLTNDSGYLTNIPDLAYYSSLKLTPNVGGNSTATLSGTDLEGYNEACLNANQFVPIVVGVENNNRGCVIYPRLDSNNKLQLFGQYVNENGLMIRIVNNGDWITNPVIGQLNQIEFWFNTKQYLAMNNSTFYVPTNNYNPATKKYVDDKVTTKQDILVSGTNIKTINNESILGSGNINIQGGGSTIQYDVMPTPSLEFINKIIQYTGTNGIYKNGYFYKCKSNTIPSKIITTGNSLLPLNIHIDNHKFELKFKPTTLDGWHKLMATEEDGYGAIILTNESTAIFGIDGDYYYQYDIDWQSENLYTALYNGDDGIFGINGTTVDSITSYDNTYYLNLFASNSENMDEAYKGEFYGLKVWDKTNDELIMNLVPSQNNNTPALYDTINQTYYYDNYSSMTYVAGGTTYYWERVDIQPSSNITGLDFTWENSWQKINASDKLLGQFLDIVNNYNENILKPYSLGSYLLSSVSMQGQDQGNDYTAFELAFEKIEDRNDKKRYIYFYANYDQTEIYDSGDATYYPKTGSEQDTILASSDDFLNYLSKYNTDEYVPISDFNPATKAYVDSNTIQKTELPSANQNVGKVYQFIGNSTYKKGGFYTSVSSGQLETALQVNDNSKYELNFNYNGDDRVEIKFKPFNEYPDDLGILGNNDNDGNQLQVHFYDENIYVGTGTEEVSASMYVPNTDYVVVIHGDNDSIIINNNVIQTGATFGYSSNSILCSYNDNTNFRGLFYYMKVYDAVTGNLKYNFVPDTYNGTVAIHETINDNYVYNTYTENNTIVQVSGEYIWKEVNDYFEPTVITSSDSTYTIANLQRNMVYKLGELSALTITACEDFNVASTIYFTSGSTPTTISLPNNVTGVDNTISANKSYIVEIKNRIAIFKEY